MKIVFVNPVGAIGGAERALLTIMDALINTKPDIQIYLIAGTDGAMISQAEKLGVEVKVLKLPEGFNQLGDSALQGSSKIIGKIKLLFQLVSLAPSLWQYLQEFRQTIELINPNIIHTNGIKANLITSLAGIKNIPVIWHIQDFYGARPLVAKLLKWSRKKATIAIAISQSVAEDVKKTLPGLPVEVIYSAINIHYFSPPNSPAINSLANCPIKVGLVATFARWKGHDIFLEAASEIIKTYPEINVGFCIVGGAIYKTRGSQFSEQELKEKATHLNIADKVDFLGFQEDIAAIYRSLDIVVHASTQPEPFGLAIVEAMACGKPVIVSQAGGAAELFTHNYDAVGVPPGEPKALAAAIVDLLNNPEKRQLLSEQARYTVTERFSHERLGEQILSVYKNTKLNY
ncbi:glycosyltransferase family 4 protein [Sphaerospermopsis aphanizomenoides BCCUSP55]|uniref:glycosyltransferase family 4 protein n=1 Tax=Sphaerospermopsis aphanizomenoides TaxID=459663 RepID=UPI0019057C4D|nr:glycosyltransferase family 4 protein [Sphaerospermopsis aphanizomenoides]MBK1988958.1 glycosyltransferase family 4 protein [Sphaerospermopsis aphanizomenoides BCCUSP55]